MKKWMMIVAACWIVCAGCQKNERAYIPEQQAPTKTEMLTQPNEETLIGNPENPLDWIGKVHNEGLYALRVYALKNQDTTRAGARKFLIGYFKEQKNTDIQLSEQLPMEKEITQDFQSVLLELPSTQQGKILMKQMVEALTSIKSVDDTSYWAFHQKILTIEQEISKSKLAKKEKELLWITSSLMRYSGYFWMMGDAESLINPNDQAYAARKGKVMRFFKKVAGVITGIAADVSAAGWHYVKGSLYTDLVSESINMSYICGYYTGWWEKNY